MYIKLQYLAEELLDGEECLEACCAVACSGWWLGWCVVHNASLETSFCVLYARSGYTCVRTKYEVNRKS